MEENEITCYQWEILRKVANGGQTSKSSLTKDLGKHYSDMHKAVKTLVENNELKIIDKIQGRGKKEEILGLTDNSITHLINNDLTVDAFWNMIVFVYDKTSKHNHITIDLDKLVDDYLKINLNYSPEVNPFYFIRLQTIKNTLKGYDENVYDRCIELLKYFANKKYLTFKKIHQDLSYIKQVNISNLNSKNIFNTLDLLLEEELVTINNIKNTVIYTVSQFGLLFLLQRFHFDVIVRKNTIGYTIQDIVTNYVDYLPLIFKKWGKLQTLKDESFLLEIFNRLYFNTQIYSYEKIELNKSRKLSNSLYSMELTKREEIQYFVASGLEIFKNWLKKNKTDMDEFSLGELIIHPIIYDLLKKPMPVENLENSKSANKKKIKQKDLDIMSNILPIIHKLQQFHESLPLNEGVSLYPSIEKVPSDNYKNDVSLMKFYLGNIISFQFYSMLRFNLEKNTWDEFLQNNSDLKAWYDGWFESIFKFENENLVFIKKLI